jgi:hypothetical protein
VLLLIVLGAAVGCGGAAAVGAVSALRPSCALDEQFLQGACRPAAGRERLAAGEAALAKFEVEAATAELDAAAAAGPLDYDSHVKLWEQRGIAAAYMEDEPGALRAFATLLTLDPGHLLSYTLSPRATFVFEKARQAARRAPAPAVQVTWRRDARVAAPLPVDLEVVEDPRRVLHHATLALRARGEPTWRAVDVGLRPPGTFQRVTLPPVPGARAVTLELYLRVFDAQNNEVLRWASPQTPRELALRYDPPEPWYRRWWVRVLGGSALVLGTAATVYAVTREPPATVGGEVVVKAR